VAGHAFFRRARSHPHVDALQRTFSVPCPYLEEASAGDSPDNLSISAQWSRRMNSLKLWLTLRVHGRRAYQELIDHQMKLAQGFAKWAATSEAFPAGVAHHKLAGARDRPRPATTSRVDSEIINDVNRNGQRWISGAVVNGQSVIRTMIISYLSEERHLQGLQTALQAARYPCRLPSNSKEARLASL